MATTTLPITKRGAEKLREELHRLKTVERPAVINAIAEARAKAVAAYLDALGYSGRIETVGRGTDDPFQADDPGKLTPDQKAKLERRVEYAPGG